MKVGIISMQRIINYGSFLQAYSLKKTIENLGHTVTFIDYKIEPCLKLEKIQDHKLVYFLKRVYRKLQRIWKQTTDQFNRQRTAEQKLYREFITLFRACCYRELGLSVEREYRTPVDVLVIGSDEVFNCLQLNADVGYSLELFGKNRSADTLISYAASFGNTTIKKLNIFGVTAEIKTLLEEFDALSVRDENTSEVISSLLPIKPLLHLDPVFIYDYADQIQGPPVRPIQDYIIVYAYTGRITTLEAQQITAIARKYNKKLVSLGVYYDFCDEYIPAEPFDVMRYFRDADYVVTDTFHGTIFSIKLNKKFATFVRESDENEYGNSEKLTDLLERFSLTDRIVRDPAQLENVLFSDWDCESANELVQKETLRSQNYLREAITQKAPK